MTLIFIVVFVSYAVLVAFLIIGWKRAIHTKREMNGQNEFISVIVPVRNESANIGFLLDDLLQGRSGDFFEVIIVDDHSEDDTTKVVEHKLKSSHSNYRIIQSSGHGKKSALATGIQHAKGNIILTTDADCRVSPTWVHTVNLAFANDDIKMVVGPVRIESNQTFFSKLQSFEFSSLIASGASTLSFGFPTMCNGANLAFRKEVFLEVNGYEGNETIASGDDEFLLRKISTKYPREEFLLTILRIVLYQHSRNKHCHNLFLSACDGLLNGNIIETSKVNYSRSTFFFFMWLLFRHPFCMDRNLLLEIP